MNVKIVDYSNMIEMLITVRTAERNYLGQERILFKELNPKLNLNN